jgi:PadR family transcriptional regulator, regulatory protein PadR
MIATSIDIREDCTNLLPSSGRSRRLTRTEPNEQVLQGTLDLLILKTLSLEPMHGWGLAHRIQELSRDALRVGQGSIYAAIVRLEQRGWVSAQWRTTENNRRAKYYSITVPGRRAMSQELESWKRFVGAVTFVLNAS